jgi:hypothetical protein
MDEPNRDLAATAAAPTAPAVGLVDLLDRIVDTGVSVSGDVIIALAGVDLIRLDLRLLLVGVETALEGSLTGLSPHGEGAA